MKTYAIKLKREYPNTASKDNCLEPLFGHEFYMLRVKELDSNGKEPNPEYAAETAMHIQDGIAPTNPIECFEEICIEIESDSQTLDICSFTGIHTCIASKHWRSELVLSSFMNSIFQLEQIPINEIAILPIYLINFLKEVGLPEDKDIRLLVLGQTKECDNNSYKTFLSGEHYRGMKLVHLNTGKSKTLFHPIQERSEIIRELSAAFMSPVLSECGLHNSSKETVMIFL